jgi:hypothetical protein
MPMVRGGERGRTSGRWGEGTCIIPDANTALGLVCDWTSDCALAWPSEDS